MRRRGLSVFVTCWPDEVDRDDCATAGAKLLFNVRVESSANGTRDGPAVTVANLTSCTPEEMERLGGLLVEQAGKAGEYLDRYRHASSDAEISGGGQFCIEAPLSPDN